MTEPWDNLGTLIEPDEETTRGGMGGATSYSIVEGEFFLKSLPAPDKQFVKKTVQGISDSFTYESDDLSLGSIVNESDKVKVTEMVYQGEVHRVVNRSKSKTAAMGLAPNHTFNRIICEYGSGEYKSLALGTSNLSSSTCDDIIAIAVEDITPFLLKTLDASHTAKLKQHKNANSATGQPNIKYTPSDDIYVQHLTPSKQTRCAIIETPTYLKSEFGVPPHIEVHYDAIDLTGEVIAGTNIVNAHTVVNDFAKPYIKGDNSHAGHLVVKQTHPSGTTVYASKSTGSTRVLSDLLRRPYDTALGPASPDDVPFTIYSPGGLISIPTKDLKKPLKSNILKSAPTGDYTPSPFINIDDCMVNKPTSYSGYGRPMPIPSITVPDPTTKSDYHLLTVHMGKTIGDSKSMNTLVPYGNAPSITSLSSNRAFDVIDNLVTKTELLVLIHPHDRKMGGALLDLSTVSNNPAPHTVVLEYSLMQGRIEEIEPGTSTNKEAGLTIRGRSMMSDLADQNAERDFGLDEGTFLKEIGDLGTPTVSLSLGGSGQGAIDIKPSRVQHPKFPGWKDRIVGSGNASVRNDKQASTYYASTRAITEFPLFPSMFFDSNKIIYPNSDTIQPLPSEQNFEMTIDCTMTATNRPEMKNQESRFSIDWGIKNRASSFEVTDSIYKHSLGNSGNKSLPHRPLIRCQRPNVQAVVVSVDAGAGTVTVDDASAWATPGENGASTALVAQLFITIGEGVLGRNGYVAKASLAGNVFTITHATELWAMDREYRSDEATSLAVALITDIKAGMTVTMGGYLVGSDAAALDPWVLAYNAHPNLTKATIATDIAAGVATLLSKTHSSSGAQDIVPDNDNPNKWWILNGPSMEAFDFDCDEVLYSFADRPLNIGVDCRPAALSLKGKTSDGQSLKYVRPMKLDFTAIANANRDFNSCYDEVLRRINMAAHPQAKNTQGGSAFDPPSPFTTVISSDLNTGSHMGYVRAIEGKEVESRSGEKGKTIVIHSTVPGATSRNFAIWFNNKSPYPYQPVQCIGSGGLIATNSSHYQANSFPAPLPLGSDGETYVPITTFTGGVHGKLVDDLSGTPRTYSGIGQRLKVKTVIPVEREDSQETPLTGGALFEKVVHPRRAIATQAMHGVTVTMPAFNAGTSPPIKQICVDNGAKEALLSLASEIGPHHRGVLQIGGKKAYFEQISPNSSYGSRANNGLFIRNITPFEETEKFYDSLFTKDAAGAEQDAVGLEIEILYPLVNSKGILFFGGGHTGMMLDISDGSSNDYSDSYKHHYSKGPTGFSGLQNLHETNNAAAVLDFTHLKNTDTINEDSYIGLHHKMREHMPSSNPQQVVVNDCLMYLPMHLDIETLSAYTVLTQFDPTDHPFPQNSEGFHVAGTYTPLLKEHIYGRYQKLSLPAGSAGVQTAPFGPTQYKPMQFHPHTGAGSWPTSGYPYLICHDYKAPRPSLPTDKLVMPTVPHIGPNTGHGYMDTTINRPLSAMKPFTISFWFNVDFDNGGANNGWMTGPIIHGIDYNGNPWGISMGGNTVSAGTQSFNFALHAAHNDLKPIYARIDETAYMAIYGSDPRITKNVWHHVVFVHDGNSSGATKSTAKLILDGSDLTSFLDIDYDQLYVAAAMANSRVGTTSPEYYPSHAQQGVPTSEGVPDHPYVPLANGPASTVDATKAVRKEGMTTVGVALHGGPFTPAGHYFCQGPDATAGNTYGSTAPSGGGGTNGLNQVGPIYLHGGAVAHIGVWDRAFTVAEAQALYASRLVW